MIVSIIRLRRTQVPDELVAALVDGGIEAIEVTLPTPGALDLVARYAGQPRARIGVGTVRDRAGALAARDAGAGFFVTPTIDPEVLQVAADAGIPVYCGAATPTEIETAYRHPAVQAVKVFPAGQLGGPGYIKAIMDPLDDIPLLPTGGVGLDNVADYAALGCAGVGVGGSLVSEADVAAADWNAIRDRAAQFVTAWRGANR